MFRTWMTLAITALLITPALADVPIDKTVPLSKTGEVSISNVAGSVTVTAWDKDEVHVGGTMDEEVEEVRVNTDKAGEVEIEVVLPRRSHHGGDADLEVKVPKGAALSVETVSANIGVSGVEGALDLESVSGEVTVEGANAEAEVATVSGGIELSGEFPRVEAESVSGSIEVEGASGRVETSTTSGRIEVSGTDFDKVECESVSGRIRFEGNPKADAELSIENFSGSVTLTLPADLDATISVETHSGDISSDFGDGRVHREKYGPGAWLETEVGGGSATIEISSFSGSVKLKKQ